MAIPIGIPIRTSWGDITKLTMDLDSFRFGNLKESWVAERLWVADHIDKET